jgi:hypothetical protein
MKATAGERLWSLAIGVGLFVATLLVYDATLTPSLSYLSPDGNELATVAYTLDLAHSTGYPLYTWLGKLFTLVPIGDMAHRVNLMSALMAAGGVAMLYGVMLILLERLEDLPGGWRHMVAAATALFFGYSLTLWSQTGISEVYAPNIFMVSLQLLLLLHWARVEEADRLSAPSRPWWRPSARSLAWFAAFCLVFALSTGTHSSDLGFGLGYAVFILLVSWRFAFSPVALGVGVAAFALGMLQHLWLPFKEPRLAEWSNFYSYTLGAFPQMKFAFAWPQVPDRIVIYLDLLRQQYAVVGILVGVVGLWALLVKKPRRWWLLVLMLLVHLVFFTQYRVFDLDVFFIPSHYLYAIFIGYGLYWLVVWKRRVLPMRVGVATALLAVMLAAPVGAALWINWPLNDRSDDTHINDFYENVWEMLPEGAVLLGQRGVFGYDMFYWRLVYDVRPDVLIPSLPGAEGIPQREEFVGRALYSNQRVAPGSTGEIPRSLVGPDVWPVPVLVGGGAQGVTVTRELTLYHITDVPPILVVPDPHPQVPVGQELGGLVLVGCDVDDSLAAPGSRLHLTLYWRLVGSRTARISTALGGTILETHALGFDNLQRYVAEGGQVNGAVVEDYWIVIPSMVAPGAASLSVFVDGATVTLGDVMVREEGR